MVGDGWAVVGDGWAVVGDGWAVAGDGWARNDPPNTPWGAAGPGSAGTAPTHDRIRVMSGSKSGSAATTAGTRSPKYSISTGVPGRETSAGSHA